MLNRIATAVAAGLLISTAVMAQGADDYPSKGVKWVVPYSAGASNDTVARIMAAKLSQMWNQPVIIENKAGAGGTIGATAVAKAEPDGYTLLMTNPGSNVNAFALRTSSPYAAQDFTHVGQLGWAPIVLATRADFPAASVSDLVKLAKAKPGDLTAGSSGIAGSSHLALELFKLRSGTDIRHIPYKGAANAINDLVGGQIDMVFVTPASISSLVQAGKVKQLGVAGEKRLTNAPNVPTMQEQGVDGFNMKIWFGVSVPAGTPGAVVRKLNRDLIAALEDPEVRQRIETLGLQIDTTGPEDFAKIIADDIGRTRDIARTANIPIK